MTEDIFKDLCLCGETTKVQFKESFTSQKEIAKEMIAFANTKGGVILFGVEVRINLADCLAQGRGAFENMNYSAQEFLDREYDYKLDFFLKGDQWQYMQLGISILDWSKRIQRADL